jgi:hypothetical protein
MVIAAVMRAAIKVAHPRWVSIQSVGCAATKVLTDENLDGLLSRGVDADRSAAVVRGYKGFK